MGINCVQQGEMEITLRREFLLDVREREKGRKGRVSTEPAHLAKALKRIGGFRARARYCATMRAESRVTPVSETGL